MTNPTIEQLQLVIGGRLALGAGCPGDRAISGQLALGDEECGAAVSRWAVAADRAIETERLAWAGQGGLVTEKPPRFVPPGCWALVVDDARRALCAWAKHLRDLHGEAVVAAIGADEPASLVSLLQATLPNAGSSISHQVRGVEAGLRLCASLASLSPAQRTAVVGLEASDASRLLRVAQPDVAVCSNEGEAQVSAQAAIGALDRLRGVLGMLPSHTLAILPGDEPLSRRAAAEAPGRVLFVGRGGDCDLTADRVACRDGKLTFCVEGQEFELSTWGRHRLTPALAAIAAARELGQTLADSAAALATWEDIISPAVSEPTGILTIGPVRTSEYRAALAMLREIPAAGRRVVVCGQDGWEAAPRWRRRMGQLAVQDCGADLVLAYGEHSDEVARGARRAGLPAERAVVCHDEQEAQRFALRALRPGDTVLLHGPGDRWRTEARTERTARRAA